MTHRPYDTPIAATPEQGIVLLDGPDGVALSLTPAAARKSAEHIRVAAEQAQLQQDDAQR